MSAGSKPYEQVEALLRAGYVPEWMIPALAEGVRHCDGGYADGRPCDDCQRVAKLPGVMERMLEFEKIERGLDIPED